MLDQLYLAELDLAIYVVLLGICFLFDFMPFQVIFEGAQKFWPRSVKSCH